MNTQAEARSILERMNYREVLVAPVHQRVFETELRELATADFDLEEAAYERRVENLCAAYGYSQSDPRAKPFPYVDGLAIIPIHGALINRFSYSWGFVTGYSYIRRMLNAALDDEDVKKIVFDVNSGGGEAAGCFELAAEIRKARSRKSLLAVVDSNCYSAAYALASACSKVVVTPSGGAGSIGVIAMHVSWEKALKTAGVKVTIIAEDEHKADGNPYEDLSDGVEADLRASVKKRYGEFVALVATNRKLKEDSVRATKSRVFRADDALELKLIDAVATPTEAVAAFLGEQGGDSPETDEDEDMSGNASQTPTPAPAPAAAAPAPAAAPAAAAPAPTAAEGASAERTRISGIMNCDEAKGRDALANHLAFNTDMSVDAAKGILAAAPTASAPAPAQTAATPAPAGDGAFAQAMDSGQHPQVGADAASASQPTDKPSRAKAAMAVVFGTPKEARQ